MIARHAHGYYRNIAVAAIYAFPSDSSSVLTELEFYAQALRVCIDSCPCLSSTYSENAAGELSWQRVKQIDIRDHFSVLSEPSTSSKDAGVDDIVAELLRQLHNEPQYSFLTRTSAPNWRLDTYQLPASQGSQQVLISFTYDHTIADGISGMMFHRILIKALNTRHLTDVSAETVFETRSADLPGLPHLPVSVSYLLKPALGQYLPTFLSKMLGVRPSVSGSDATTWVGSNTFAPPPGCTPATAVQILTVGNKTLSTVLDVCRKHKTGLTALLNEILAGSFSRHLSAYSVTSADKTSFITAVPTDIRHTVGTSSDTTGVFSSAAYLRVERCSDPHPDNNAIEMDDQTIWESARKSTATISDSRLSATNQPTGLLAWVNDFDAFYRQQIGVSRGGSWEISNLLSFKADLPVAAVIKVEKMYFSQPADATGSPVSFNIVSVDGGGEMTVCASWQPGAFDLDVSDTCSVQEREDEFVGQVLGDLKVCLERVAMTMATV